MIVSLHTCHGCTLIAVNEIQSDLAGLVSGSDFFADLLGRGPFLLTLSDIRVILVGLGQETVRLLEP